MAGGYSTGFSSGFGTAPVIPTVASDDWATHEFYFQLLRYFPEYMQESEVVQKITELILQEVRVRTVDVMDAIQRNLFAFSLDEFGILRWEQELGLPIMVNDTLDKRRARVIALRIRRSGMRAYDMARIAYHFVGGIRTYVTTASDGDTIHVLDTSAFFIGQEVFLGNIALTITNIDHVNLQITVDQDVAAYPFDVLSEKVVAVYEKPAIHFFFLAMEKEQIVDLDGMIVAIRAAKPAHLNFIITDYQPIPYSSPDYTYAGLVGPEAPLLYTGVEILYGGEL